MCMNHCAVRRWIAVKASDIPSGSGRFAVSLGFIGDKCLAYCILSGLSNFRLCLTFTLLQRWHGALPDSDWLIKQIRTLLIKNQNQLQLGNIVGIPTARIPVIKFTHIPTQLSGDVSFNRR